MFVLFMLLHISSTVYNWTTSYILHKCRPLKVLYQLRYLKLFKLQYQCTVCHGFKYGMNDCMFVNNDAKMVVLVTLL